MLTVAEKNHWKSRITARIDKAIEKLKRDNETAYRALHLGSVKEAAKALKIDSLLGQLLIVAKEKEALEKKEHKLEKAIMQRIRGVEDIEDLEGCYYNDSDTEKAIAKRAHQYIEEALTSFAWGNQILALEAEKENLLDTVWLATSSVQIKELWNAVLATLGESSTSLQQQALAIPHAKE